MHYSWLVIWLGSFAYNKASKGRIILEKNYKKQKETYPQEKPNRKKTKPDAPLKPKKSTETCGLPKKYRANYIRQDIEK